MLKKHCLSFETMFPKRIKASKTAQSNSESYNLIPMRFHVGISHVHIGGFCRSKEFKIGRQSSSYHTWLPFKRTSSQRALVSQGERARNERERREVKRLRGGREGGSLGLLGREAEL